MKNPSLAYVVLILTYLVSASNIAYGVIAPPPEDGVWTAVNKNSRGTVTNPMGFQQWLPNDYSTSGTTTYKLIVFLHGSGQRGNGSTDLPKVLTEGLPKQITSLGWNGQTGSTKWIILCPQQSLIYHGWIGEPKDQTPNDGIEFINWVKNHSGLRVDWNNGIYITGLSMGAPWSVVGYTGANYPANYFAAMSAYAGAANAGYQVGRTIGNRDIPVWALMGGSDNTFANGAYVKDVMGQTINGIKSVNPSTPPIYNLNVSGYGHNSLFWDYCYKWDQSPSLYEWFLTKTLSPPSNQPPTVDAGLDKILTLPDNSTTLNGTASDSDGTIASYQWTQVGGPAATLSGQGTPNLTASDLLVGEYTFRLTVTDNLGASSFSEVLVSVVQPTPPNSPSSLTALPTSSSTISLSWTDNSNDESGFNIERSITSLTGYTPIITTPAGSTSFSDTGLASNTTYFYRVSAVNGPLQSSYSNESSATTGKDSPTWTNIIGATADGFGTLTKTAAYGSAAGASSLEVLPAGQDGWVETKVTQTGKTRTIGLSDADTDATVTSIDYAITFTNNNEGVSIFEGGTGGWVRKFSPGQVYRIERQGSIISYWVVGESSPFRTSSIPSTTSLVVDASLLHTGAVISETTISFGSNGSSGARMANKEPQVIGRDETGKATIFTLYPNPANSILKISFDDQTEGPVRIRIIDSSGKTEWEGSRVGESEIEIDLNSINVSPGLKIVSIIKSDGKIISKKLQRLH